MKVKMIPLSMIDYGENIRTEKDADLMDLARSIEDNDIIQPLLVRPMNGRYEVVCGHRRYKAAKIAGDDMFLPCVIRDNITEDNIIEIQIEENIQRKDMSAYELCGIFDKLKKKGKTQKQIAAMFHRSEQWVSAQYSALKYMENQYEKDTNFQKYYRTKTISEIQMEREKEREKQTSVRCGKYVVYTKGGLKKIYIDCDDRQEAQRVFSILEKGI